jgi:hypothetical protein
VDLPIFSARRVTQVHCLAYRASLAPKSTNLVATTRRFRGRSADGGERYERRGRLVAPFDYLNCGSWASPPGMQFTGGSGGNRLDPRVTGIRIVDANANQGALNP